MGRGSRVLFKKFLRLTDPVDTIWAKDIENRTRFAINFGKKRGILNQGDLVLLMSCSKQNAGFNNTMRLFYVGAEDMIEA